VTALPPVELSVVVPSHDRPLRLRWLLNALEQQTLDRRHWEVIVGHDSSGPETDELLTTHPLAKAGVLRHVKLPAGTAPPGANRNAAWRIARGRWIVFTDDDCRPPEDWLAQAHAAVQEHPEAIVQGTTQKDPDEQIMLAGSMLHRQLIHPPTPWAECCNIIYPKALLEALGGFDEIHKVGEDTALFLRARRSGAEQVAAPEVMTYHAIVPLTLRQVLRNAWRWHDLPHLPRDFPEIRQHFPMWVFWKRTHFWAIPFLAGFALVRRNQAWAVLCIPWVVHSAPVRGTNPRGRYREVSDLPLRLLTDLTEMVALIRGSIRYRTFFI